ASLTALTLMVTVLADWSRSTPPLAVPPLSCTWKVKLASGDPLEWAVGVNTSRPAAMLAAETKSPAFTVAPLLVKVPVPAPGAVSKSIAAPLATVTTPVDELMANLPPALSVSVKLGAGPPPGSLDDAVMPTAVPLAAPSNTLLAVLSLSDGVEGATSVTPIV